MSALVPRFYTAGFLTGGSTYFELLKKAQDWVMDEHTVVISYDRRARDGLQGSIHQDYHFEVKVKPKDGL